MIDQSMVTSGFDVEFLMTEEFIRYFLLCSLDTGSIPWSTEVSGTSGTPPVPYRTVTIIHPPHELEDRRLYPVFPEFEGHEHAHLDLTPAYSTQAQELQVTILADDPRGADLSVRAFPAVIDTLVTPPKVLVENVPIDLAMGFNVVGTPLDDGFLGDIGIELELVDVSGPLIDAIEQLLSAPNPPPLPTRADILAQLKLTIDRRVPFAVSGGGALQRIETRTFTGDPARPSAIGVYIDLVLQKGPAPDDFLTTMRGDTADAQNFLEPGMKMGFAFPPGTFALLSDDLRFKMAKPKPNDPTQYYYPLMDGDDQIGIIKDISVRPEVAQSPNMPPVFTNTLVIDIHGEYEVDNWFDPDFHLRLTLRPETGPRGVFDFDIDFDLSLSAAATLSALFVGLAVSVFLPQLGIPLTILTVIAIKAVEHYGAEAAGSAVASEGGLTSFLDTLPHKLVVEQRRWDPLYFTDHRVETGDVDVLVNADGFAMAANELFLGRRTRPLTRHGDPQRDPCGRRNGRRAGLSGVRSPALPGHGHQSDRRRRRSHALHGTPAPRSRHRVAPGRPDAPASARPYRRGRPPRRRSGLPAGESGCHRTPGLSDPRGVAHRGRRGAGHRAPPAARRIPKPARRHPAPSGDRRAAGRARTRSDRGRDPRAHRQDRRRCHRAGSSGPGRSRAGPTPDVRLGAQ